MLFLANVDNAQASMFSAGIGGQPETREHDGSLTWMSCNQLMRENFMKKPLILLILIATTAPSVSQINSNNRISQYSTENRRTEYQHFKTDGFTFRPQDARAVFKYPDGSLGYVQHSLVNGPWNTASINDANICLTILISNTAPPAVI